MTTVSYVGHGIIASLTRIHFSGDFGWKHRLCTSFCVLALIYLELWLRHVCRYWRSARHCSLAWSWLNLITRVRLGFWPGPPQKNAEALKWLKLLFRVSYDNGFLFIARHVPGVENVAFGALGRTSTHQNFATKLSESFSRRESKLTLQPSCVSSYPTRFDSYDMDGIAEVRLCSIRMEDAHQSMETVFWVPYELVSLPA